MRLSFFATAVLGAFLCQALVTRPAYALNEDARTVIRDGAYGLAGGTLVGLAVLPLTGSARGVFIGSSLGLYMGLIAGVYQVTHREDRSRGRSRYGEDTPPRETLTAFQGSSPLRNEAPVQAKLFLRVLSF